VPAGQTPQYTYPSALQPGNYYPNGYGRNIPQQVVHHPQQLPGGSPDQQSYSPHAPMNSVYTYQANNLPNATPLYQSSRPMQAVPPSSFLVPRISYRKRTNQSKEDSEGESTDEEGTGTSSNHTSGNMYVPMERYGSLYSLMV
jgi:hypothetical protein